MAQRPTPERRHTALATRTDGDSTPTVDIAAGDHHKGARPATSAATHGRGVAIGVRIDRLIIHHLDHRSGRKELVDEVATLDVAGERFFASHVASAAERADWHARFREGDEEVAGVPTQLLGLLGDEEQFVAASRALADRLYRYMVERSGNIAPGDFVAIAYTLDDTSTRHVALLKMDPDQQRLTRQFSRHAGRLRVAISVAANLLPEAKSLQKCALISRDDATRAFSVRLLDTQAGPRSDGVAAFFYRDFLAATLTASARRQTRLFLTETNAWFQAHSAALRPRELLTFFQARRAALKQEYVRLREFAASALPAHADLADDLVRALTIKVFEEESLLGDAPFFQVDAAATRKYLDTVTLELDGGLRLTVSADRFEDLVRLAEERTGEGKLLLTVESQALREVTS